MAKKRAVPSPKQETLNIPSFLMNPVTSRVPDGAPASQNATRRQRPKRPKKVETQQILELAPEPEVTPDPEPKVEPQTSLELNVEPTAQPDTASGPEDEQEAVGNLGLEPEEEAKQETEQNTEAERDVALDEHTNAALTPEQGSELDSMLEDEAEEIPVNMVDSDAKTEADAKSNAEDATDAKQEVEAQAAPEQDQEQNPEPAPAQAIKQESAAEPEPETETETEPATAPEPEPELEPETSTTPASVSAKEEAPEDKGAPKAKQDEPKEEADKTAESDVAPNNDPKDEPLQRALKQEEELDAVMQTVFEAAGVPVLDEAKDYTFGSFVEAEPEPETASATSQPAPDAAEPTRVPSLKEDLAMLNKVERRLYAHRYASTEIMTFGESIDPPKAAVDRAEALAVLVEEDHELLSKPEVGGMVERLANQSTKLDPLVAKQVAVLARDRRELVSVPASLQARLVHVQTESYEAWLAAKANNDWASFAPYLDRLVNLRRRVAEAIDPNADPYDTMLDMHEKGTNRAFYNNFFARVKQCVVPLLSSISMSGRTLSRNCIEGRFDTTRQWELAHDIMQLQGIDQKAHFLASTEHPFSDAMTSNYAITAARVVPDDVMSNVYTMLHELGHNLYEQGVDPKFNRTSLKGGTSMGIHESQSRLFENYIGRDRAFIPVLLSLMKQRFPGQMGRVTPNQLYRAVNRVVPSLIRMDADELTYPLHIIVRYEIEQLLVSGKATARDVPRLWASRYSRYIGANVPDDTHGALQDVHWAEGDFGYFPTYALGNAYAAQMRAKMIDEGMDWSGVLASGNLEPIRAWLHERVWQYGRSKDPSEIIKDACGEAFTPRHYANYLTHKFAALYSLR